MAFTDVTVLSMGMGTFTKQDGRFVILRIHSGDYYIRASKQNYEHSNKLHLRVSPSETTEVTLELWPLYDCPRSPRQGPEPGHVIDTKPREQD